jgi:hypothetical protein
LDTVGSFPEAASRVKVAEIGAKTPQENVSCCHFQAILGLAVIRSDNRKVCEKMHGYILFHAPYCSFEKRCVVPKSVRFWGEEGG